MASQGVKRKAEVEVSLRNARARCSGLEEEVDEVKKVLAVTKEKLRQSEEALQAKNNASHEDSWKRMELMNEVTSLKIQNIGLQQSRHAACQPFKVSLALAQRELKVCQLQLKQCMANSERAEKAERKVDSLSAEMSEIGELTEDMRAILPIELDGGSSSVGGFKGVLQVLRAVRDQLKNDSNDQVIVNLETATMKEGDAGERERAVAARVRAAEEEKEEVVRQLEELSGKEADVARERDAALGESERLRASLATIEEQMRGSEVKLAEGEKRAAEEAGVLRGELEMEKTEVVALQQWVRVAEGEKEELQQELQDVNKERDAALAESKKLRASLVAAEEQLEGLKVRLEEEANKAAHEAGVYQRELDMAKLELESRLKRVQAAEKRTGEALKQLGELTGGEAEQKLNFVERDRDAALDESKKLRASLESALEKYAAKKKELKGLEVRLAEGETRTASEAGVLRTGLQRAEKTMDEMKVQLHDESQRAAGLLDELARCKKDVQLVDGQKEAGEQVQNLLSATQGLEAGEASCREKRELEKELSESMKRTKAVQLRLHNAQFANKVIASDAEHKKKSLADMALRNAQQLVENAKLRKQIGIMQEVFRYAGIGSTGPC